MVHNTWDKERIHLIFDYVESYNDMPPITAHYNLSEIKIRNKSNGLFIILYHFSTNNFSDLFFYQLT